MTNRNAVKTAFRVSCLLLMTAPLCVANEPQRPRLAVVLPAVPPEWVQELQGNPGGQARARQIGFSRRLDEPVLLRRGAESGSEPGDGGEEVRTIFVASPGAKGVRLGLEELRLPPGARLWLKDALRPSLPARRVEVPPGAVRIWSPTVFTDAVELICELPAGGAPFSLKLVEVSHLYATAAEGAESQASCLHDVACYDNVNRSASAVGLVTYVEGGNTYVCSGSLVQGASASSVYFLTANHCVHSSEVASSVEVFWKYEAGSCEGLVPDLGSVPATTGGAQLLASSADNDFALLRLHRSPPQSVTPLRWSLAPPSAGARVTCIHHPQGGPKRISFGSSLGEAGFFWPVRWDLGVTQPGSSGSPLLNDRGELIGILSGGFNGPGSSCEYPEQPDEFGRFDIVYAKATGFFSRSDTATSYAAGTYQGLFSTPGLQTPPGFVMLTSTTKGKYSGRGIMDGKKFSFSGVWQLDGSSETRFRTKTLESVALRLQADPEDPSSIRGELEVRGSLIEMELDRVGVGGWTSDLAGQYTMVVTTGSGTASEMPAGDGYGWARIDSGGRLRFSGSLADGTKFSQAGYLSGNGAWVLFQVLDRGNGVLAGLVEVGEEVYGNVIWQRGMSSGRVPYPSGFYSEPTVYGQRYMPGPISAPFTPGDRELAFGPEPISLTTVVRVEPGGRVMNLGEGKMALKFSSTTGVFSGKFSGASTSERVRFGGVVLQNLGEGRGYFLQGGQSGAVLLR